MTVIQGSYGAEMSAKDASIDARLWWASMLWRTVNGVSAKAL